MRTTEQFLIDLLAGEVELSNQEAFLSSSSTLKYISKSSCSVKQSVLK